MPREQNKRDEPKPFYPLAEVKQLIAKGKVRIQQNALESALNDFEWGPDEILKAMCELEPEHFHKQDVMTKNRMIVIDVYHAPRLREEAVYTHFYINDEKDILVINSFKQLE